MRFDLLAETATDLASFGTLPFRVDAPAQQRVPYVFNSPHSGNRYPPRLLAASGLSALDLRRSEDVAVDALFASVVPQGAPMLAANFPRAWLDVNREPYELDPRLFDERLPAHANTRSSRVVGGLGTIARLVAENMPIYAERPTLAEGLARVDAVYRPYHARLHGLMRDTAATFGHAVLVDCHSMPSQAAGQTTGNDNGPRHDIVVGDRYGVSCNGAISRLLMDEFAALGYAVARNKPYAGGFITEHYGKPLRGLHAVQIEINRALYLDEARMVPGPGFAALEADIATVMARLMALPDADFAPHLMAAE
ncbi:N-formylglutamate amidohydrolase [Rhizobiaceae bacterium]|nr:N-formylglutamate amidohydrolase [Rhizobiaceae bacterium]